MKIYIHQSIDPVNTHENGLMTIPQHERKVSTCFNHGTSVNPCPPLAGISGVHVDLGLCQAETLREGVSYVRCTSPVQFSKASKAKLRDVACVIGRWRTFSIPLISCDELLVLFLSLSLVESHHIYYSLSSGPFSLPKDESPAPGAPSRCATSHLQVFGVGTLSNLNG